MATSTRTRRRLKKKTDTGVEHLTYGSTAPMAGLDLGRSRKKAAPKTRASARRKTARSGPVVYK